MANVLISETYLQDIADSIRSKTGSQGTIKPSEMSVAVVEIPSPTYNWTSLGFSEEPDYIGNDFNSATNIKNNWNDATTSMYRTYYGNTDIRVFPSVDTSHVTYASECFGGSTNLKAVAPIDTSHIVNVDYMFDGCANLQQIPTFDFSAATSSQYVFRNCSKLVTIPQMTLTVSKSCPSMFQNCTSLQNFAGFSAPVATNLSNMFNGCPNLTDDSLNNILASCLTAVKLSSGNKKLSYLGFNSNAYSAARIQALDNYQDFVDGGWSIGY